MGVPDVGHRSLRVSITLERAVANLLAAAASASGEAVSTLIRDALTAYLDTDVAETKQRLRMWHAIELPTVESLSWSRSMPFAPPKPPTPDIEVDENESTSRRISFAMSAAMRDTVINRGEEEGRGMAAVIRRAIRLYLSNELSLDDAALGASLAMSDSGDFVHAGNSSGPSHRHTSRTAKTDDQHTRARSGQPSRPEKLRRTMGAEMAEQVREEEHERRFLITETSVTRGGDGERIEQAYLWSKDGYAVRVRLSRPENDPSALPEATFALKGPRHNAMRYEMENPIPAAHAFNILKLCAFKVAKVRYPVISERETWVVDVFEGENQGLIVAEFEGSAIAVDNIRKPWWCGTEVTGDSRYDNENLAKRPWGYWGPETDFEKRVDF